MRYEKVLENCGSGPGAVTTDESYDQSRNICAKLNFHSLTSKYMVLSNGLQPHLLASSAFWLLIQQIKMMMLCVPSAFLCFMNTAFESSSQAINRGSFQRALQTDFADVNEKGPHDAGR